MPGVPVMPSGLPAGNVRPVQKSYRGSRPVAVPGLAPIFRREFLRLPYAARHAVVRPGVPVSEAAYGRFCHWHLKETAPATQARLEPCIRVTFASGSLASQEY